METDRTRIYKNIASYFGCGTDDISGFRKMAGGLSNTSFLFTVGGVPYVYRHPGVGNGKYVNRAREKRALAAARQLGFETAYMDMDSDAGWKISRYIPVFRKPDYGSAADSRKVAGILRKLHNSGAFVFPSAAGGEIRRKDSRAPDAATGHGIRPWDDACEMETEIRKRLPGRFAKYASLKEKVHILYLQTQDDGVPECFCHGDTYAPNWMFLPDGRVILTDWEYAGISDPGMDIGYYIADAGYGFEDAEAFIRLYLGDTWSRELNFHFQAYVAIAAWYWMVWAMYRTAKEPAGSGMRDAIRPYFKKWSAMAEKYAAEYCL